MSRPAAALMLSEAEAPVLGALSKSRLAAHREVQRAQVLLMAAEGFPNEWIAKLVKVTPGTVRAWRTRFAAEGLKKLGAVAPGRGRKKVIPETKIAEVLELTRFSKTEGATHWSVRSMAARAGVSPAQMQGIWAGTWLETAQSRDIQALHGSPL